jgi:hypothetical protein
VLSTHRCHTLDRSGTPFRNYTECCSGYANALPGYFLERLGPALGSLLEAAAASGEIRADVSPRYLLYAVANLCLPVADEGVAYSQRMVALLVDGLRYGAGTSQPRS